MLGSAVVYSGLILAVVGLIAMIRPIRRLGLSPRRRGFRLAMMGILIVVIGVLLPAPESRVTRRSTRLDEFMPAWQFREVHTTEVAAPPAKVFEAIESVRADEILFFRTLTWIRRGGRELPQGILNAGASESLIDIALKGGFIRLERDSAREIVIGTVVVAPRLRGPHGELTAEAFLTPLPPGFAIAAMNFLVSPDGEGRSRVITETRVFANNPDARRRFAAYWRLIYPGSAIIRRMWLRAVRLRAIRELSPSPS